jgi:ribosome-binding protein aMBF1 (putative translation factor)
MSQIIYRGKHDIIRVGDPENETPSQAVGANIREIRADAGMSMRQLSALLGIKGTLLSDIENGHRPIEETQEVLTRMGKLLAGVLPE